MEVVRNSWTDERLDDGFDRVTADISLLREELRTETGALREGTGALRKELHAEVGALRRELHAEIGSVRTEVGALRRDVTSEVNSFRLEVGARLDHVESRFDDLHRVLLQLGSGVIVALLGLIATQL